MEITDRLLGHGQHCLRIVFILHPDVRVVDDAQGFQLTMDDSGLSAIFHPASSLQTSLEEGCFHPEFGLTLPTRIIVCTQQFKLPQNLTHRIQWAECKW